MPYTSPWGAEGRRLLGTAPGLPDPAGLGEQEMTERAADTLLNSWSRSQTSHDADFSRENFCLEKIVTPAEWNEDYEGESCAKSSAVNNNSVS